MKNNHIHIPFLDNIEDFFQAYGMKKPLHPEVMCMRLEDQEDERLLYMPLCRINFFRIVHFENADLQFKVDDKGHTVFEHCLAFSYPSKLESWTRKGRLYGTVLYFSAAFAGLDSGQKNVNTDYPFFNFNSEPLLPLSPNDVNILHFFETEMVKEMYSDAPDRLAYLKKLIALYLHAIRRIYDRQFHNQPTEIQNNKAIFNNFRAVLDEKIQNLAILDNKQTPSVSSIAKDLNLNANYLNNLIKKLTGKTASSFIQEKLLLEAKSYLLHTSLQVAEIAYQLGFDTPQYFNRFFKKHTTLTPSDFRQQFSRHL